MELVLPELALVQRPTLRQQQNPRSVPSSVLERALVEVAIWVRHYSLSMRLFSLHGAFINLQGFVLQQLLQLFLIESLELSWNELLLNLCQIQTQILHVPEAYSIHT